MASFLFVVVAVAVVSALIYRVIKHGDGIVARRGMSVGADLGALSDARRMRVEIVSDIGTERVRVILTPLEPSPSSGEEDMVVVLGRDEFGYELLQRWQQSGEAVGLVLPPGGRLVRLRSINDLQHLTLRRA